MTFRFFPERFGHPGPLARRLGQLGLFDNADEVEAEEGEEDGHGDRAEDVAYVLAGGREPE